MGWDEILVKDFCTHARSDNRFALHTDHPGGWEILRQLAMDKEDGNEQFEDIKHTDDARALAQKYLIGRVENGGMKPFPKAGELRPPLLTIKKPDDSGSMIMLAGAVIVAAAVGAFAYSRQKKN